MIRHVWSVACSKASIDNQTNNISLFEVLEQLQVPHWPERPPDGVIGVGALPLEIVSLWIRVPLDVPERGECRIRVRAPGGSVLESGAQVMDLAAYRRFRSRFSFPGLPIDEPGLCEIEVLFRTGADAEWRIVAQIPIEMRTLEPPAAAAPA
jgi:hypothetical protein